MNYWICCHYDLDNCTTDLYLLLYCYLEINCLSLKLLVWCLLPYPEPISRQGCCKPLHCPNLVRSWHTAKLPPVSSCPGTKGFCSSQPRENPTEGFISGSKTRGKKLPSFFLLFSKQTKGHAWPRMKCPRKSPTSSLSCRWDRGRAVLASCLAVGIISPFL